MKKTIELEEMNVILRIPAETAAVTVSAAVIDKKGKLQKVKKKLTLKEIHEARAAFLDNVDGGDDYDGKFIITEEGRRYLEEKEKERLHA